MRERERKIKVYNENMSSVDAHLEIDPEQVIEFVLVDATTTTSDTTTTAAATTTTNAASSTHRVTLTLKHPDPDGLPIAFKVRVIVVVMLVVCVVCDVGCFHSTTFH